ncbi:MAG: YbjN domain-containing protein [Clostridia bacterium]|nr:YbjN domain-containing protein [Clostridia bacterium]
MIYTPTQMIHDALTAQGIRCLIRENEKYSFVQVSYNGENYTHLDINFISNSDQNDVSVRTSGLARVPNNRLAAIREVINECNRRYRYIKLVINDERNVTAEYDMLLSASSDTLGENAAEVCSRFANIIDKVYPEIMRAIYAEFVVDPEAQ